VSTEGDENGIKDTLSVSKIYNSEGAPAYIFTINQFRVTDVLHIDDFDGGAVGLWMYQYVTVDVKNIVTKRYQSINKALFDFDTNELTIPTITLSEQENPIYQAVLSPVDNKFSEFKITLIDSPIYNQPVNYTTFNSSTQTLTIPELFAGDNRYSAEFSVIAETNPYKFHLTNLTELDK